MHKWVWCLQVLNANRGYIGDNIVFKNEIPEEMKDTLFDLKLQEVY